MKMVQGFESTQDPITVRLKLERGDVNIVKIITEIRPKGKKGPCLKVLLAPGSVTKVVRPLWCVTTSLIWKRSSNWYLRTDFEAMFGQHGENLAYIGYSASILKCLKRQVFSSNYRDRREGTGLATL